MTQPTDEVPPPHLMRNVAWSFIGGAYEQRQTFDEEVRQYQVAVSKQDTWKADESVLRKGRVVVQYEYWNGGAWIETTVELVSDNGAFFTAGELLFKLHNAVIARVRQQDRHFFEGFRLVRQTSGAVPKYLLDLGS